MKNRLVLLTAFIIVSLTGDDLLQAETLSADVIVYKANPSGIMAAVAAAKQGMKVILVEPTAYIGGIVAQGGLVASDVGNYGTIGGQSFDFFQRVGDYYKTTYGADSQQFKDTYIGTFAGAHFEPRVAELLFENLLKEQPSIQLIRHALLTGVEKKGALITSITCQDTEKNIPLTLDGKMFIDASYCGDVMALAKVSYSLGSESRDKYGESLGRNQDGPQIQASNYRVTLTNNPDNRIPFPKPENYKPDLYVRNALRFKNLTFPEESYNTLYHLPNQKMDANFYDRPEANWGYPEGDAASRAKFEQEQRDLTFGYYYFLQNDPRVDQEFQKSFASWGLPKDEFTNNGNFPREVYTREGRRLNGTYVMSQRDLQTSRAKDDSIAIGTYGIDTHATQMNGKAEGKVRGNGGIAQAVRPYDITYRCLVPKAAECENLLVPVCLGATHVAWSSIRMEPVLMMTGEAAGIAAALAIEGKTTVQNVPVDQLQAKLTANGAKLHATVEPMADFTWAPEHPKPGEPVHFTFKPMEGSPKAATYQWNFDGTSTVGSTEAAPTFTFSQPKATLVTLVVQDEAGHNSCPVSKLVPLAEATATDVQIDSEDETGFKGTNVDQAASSLPFYGVSFGTDSNHSKGKMAATYSPVITQAGTYTVYLTSTSGGKRSPNTPVEIEDAEGKKSVEIDQTKFDPIYGLIPVGDFKFEPGKPASVTIRNEATRGYVVADIVRFVLKP